MVGPTMQPDPSREINIARAYTTSQFIPTMAAHTLSGMNMLRKSPGLGVLRINVKNSSVMLKIKN